MKSKVRLSAFSTITTYSVIVLFAIGIGTAVLSEPQKTVILLLLLIPMIVLSLYYYPKSLESTDSKVIIHRLYNDKVFECSEIAAVERCYPSAGGLRLCGSGGFFGYWGYFTDVMIGNYFGYYGDRSQCILIKLKNGKQYVVSCVNPDEMVKSIKSHIN